MTLGKVADGDDLVGRHPDIDELLQGTVDCHNTESSIVRPDQLDGGGDDALEHDGQVELFHDGLVGSQQRSQSPLDFQYIACACNQVVECQVELAARLIRKIDRMAVAHGETSRPHNLESFIPLRVSVVGVYARPLNGVPLAWRKTPPMGEVFHAVFWHRSGSCRAR